MMVFATLYKLIIDLVSKSIKCGSKILKGPTSKTIASIAATSELEILI